LLFPAGMGFVAGGFERFSTEPALFGCIVLCNGVAWLLGAALLSYSTTSASTPLLQATNDVGREMHAIEHEIHSDRDAAAAPLDLAALSVRTCAERRRISWERRKQGRWMFAAAAVFLLVILMLAADFVYARVAAAPPQAQTITAQGSEARIPVAAVNDGNLHIFNVEEGGTSLRFIVIHKPDGSWGTALDACSICGWAGYRQDGQNVVCRNCGSAIYIPTIGQAGGCNPVGVSSRVEGNELVLDLSTLAAAARNVPH
jgi:hypothetical protein